MKKKELIEIKTKTVKELVKLSSQKKVEAGKTKMSIFGGKDKNLKAYRNLRRDIAQILTIIREKEIIEKMTPKVEKKGEAK